MIKYILTIAGIYSGFGLFVGFVTLALIGLLTPPGWPVHQNAPMTLLVLWALGTVIGLAIGLYDELFRTDR